MECRLRHDQDNKMTSDKDITYVTPRLSRKSAIDIGYCILKTFEEHGKAVMKRIQLEVN